MNTDRRGRPRIWDTDWLVLRELARQLAEQIDHYIGRDANLVDLGCGSMPYRHMIESRGIAYIGADIDGKADLEINGQGRVPVGAASFDAVLSVQVLEHVLDLSVYCGEICRLMRDKGILLLSTHGTWLYHPHPEDHRRWTRTGLIADLKTQGLVVDELVPIVGPLATTTLIRLTGFAFVLRKLPIVGSALAKLLAVIMNLRALAEDAVTPDNLRRDNACVYLVRARKAGL